MPSHRPTCVTVEPLERRTLLSAIPLIEGLTAHLSTGSITFNGYTYFKANDSTTGLELWRTDGTTVGTGIVKDINPAGHSSPRSFMAFNEALLFTARDSSTGPWGLWRTDGTEPGTVKLVDVVWPSVGQYTEGWYVFGGELIGLGVDGLVATDGTPKGTHLLVSTPGSSLVATTARLYWLSADKHSVLSYDGVGLSTAAVAPGAAEDLFLTSSFGSGVQYSYRTFVNNQFVRNVVEIAPRELVVRPLQEQFRNYDNNDDLQFHGAKYFTDDQGQFWKRGATPAQDVLVHHVVRGSVTASGNNLFFADGRQLWKTDGSAAGTALVRDFPKFPTGPHDLVGTSSSLYFVIEEGANTLQPWLSDGTELGTVQAADIGPHNPPSGSIFGLGRHSSGILVGVLDRLWLIPTSPKLSKVPTRMPIAPGTIDSAGNQRLVFSDFSVVEQGLDVPLADLF